MPADFSRLVSEIYAAVTTPTQWDAAVAGIGRAFGQAQAALLVNDGRTRILKHAGLPPEVTERYNTYYSRVDNILAAVEQSPVGSVRTRAELTWPHKDSEIRADWCTPNGFRDGLFVRLTDAPSVTSFAVSTSQQSGPFDTAENLMLLRRLVPHLQQTLRMHSHVAELTRHNHDLTQAGELWRHGLVIVAPGARVAYSNSAAEAMLRSDDGLRSRISGIESECLRTGSGRSFLYPRPSGGRPYIVHVLPLDHAACGWPGSQRRTMIAIVDPELEAQPSTVLLRRLYGLTRCEADIAVLVMAGQGLKPIADALSLSVTTVKTHVQHVFDKTGTHRQAELVRLLLCHDPVYRHADDPYALIGGTSREPSAPSPYTVPHDAGGVSVSDAAG